MLADVRRTIAGMGDLQRRLFDVTGAARSDDRLITVVVGPRGQLVDLKIHPNALREPDSKGLAAAILATTRRAVEDAMAQSGAIADEAVPADLRAAAMGLDGADVVRLMRSHDADLRADGGTDDA